MKSWRNCFSGRRVAQARKKAIRIFKGRLKAFLLIFQHWRKQIQQGMASTLLANFPICFFRFLANGRAAGLWGRGESPKDSRG